MLRDEKLAYQDDLEKYMQENDVYLIIETMMKNLIVEQPADPVPYLLDVLQKPQTKRIFIMGPPGSKRKEHILTLADNFEDFKYEAICVGDLLNKEISKKSDFAKKIVDSRKTYSYPEDDIVIELVTKQIELLEKEKRNWIIEGFPRTRKQALALTKMDFIPDRMILLDVSDKLTKERVLQNLTSEEAVLKVDPDKIDSIIEDSVQEYHTHIEGVKDIYKGMISIIDGNQKQDVVLQEIARILKLKMIDAPRRAPKILLIGAPGSGKSTQAERIAIKLKVIHVKATSLLKNYINNGTDQGKQLWKLLKEGEPIPDEIFQKIIKERLEQLDVKMNGFVLDGFPLNASQMRFLIDVCSIKPSHLIFLEVSDHKAYERLEYRLFDPISGISFDASINPPKDEKVVKRLVHSPEYEHHVVKKCIKRHKEFIMDLQKKLEVDDLIIINADNDADSVFIDISSEIGL